MSYVRVFLTIPVSCKDAANRLASIFDFDVGGGSTFGACPMSPTGLPPATHYMACTPIKPEYLDALIDPQTAMVALSQLALVYDRAAPVEADVQDFCNNVSIGEPEGLVRIFEQGTAA